MTYAIIETIGTTPEQPIWGQPEGGPEAVSLARATYHAMLGNIVAAVCTYTVEEQTAICLQAGKSAPDLARDLAAVRERYRVVTLAQEFRAARAKNAAYAAEVQRVNALVNATIDRQFAAMKTALARDLVATFGITESDAAAQVSAGCKRPTVNIAPGWIRPVDTEPLERTLKEATRHNIKTAAPSLARRAELLHQEAAQMLADANAAEIALRRKHRESHHDLAKQLERHERDLAVAETAAANPARIAALKESVAAVQRRLAEHAGDYQEVERYRLEYQRLTEEAYRLLDSRQDWRNFDCFDTDRTLPKRYDPFAGIGHETLCNG